MQIFRRILFTLALVVTVVVLLVALVYAEENWRARRAWDAAQRDLAAKGETLDWSHFVPPPVPADQNLAMSAFYVRQLHYQTDPKTGVYTFGPAASRPTDLKDMPYAGPRPASVQPGGWERAVRTDFDGLARYYQGAPGFPHPALPGDPATDVVLALTRYAPALDELARAAAERPRTRFPIPWNAENLFAVALPHDNLQQQLVSTLRLRASARLATGQSAGALRDVDLALRLCRDLRDEPTLIAHLVRITSLRFLLTPIWEGLADRRWSAAELDHLQRALADLDLLADYCRAVRCERASAGVRGVDYMANHPADVLGLMDGGLGGSGGRGSRGLNRWLAPAIPRAWFDLSKVTIVRFMQTNVIEVADPVARRVYPDKVAAAERALAAMPPWPTHLLAKIMLPVYTSISRRAAQLQTNLDQAVAACALERFYLDHQRYPAALEELVPTYLPRVPTDVIDGAPLRYFPTPAGRYRLYGLGWNARDDGGQVVWAADGKRLDDKQGDWVWQYEPIQPPAARPDK